MRKYFCIILLIGAVVSLENCHRDPVVKPNITNPNDPDSLYQGTRTTLNAIAPAGLGVADFGAPKTPYADSLTLEGIQLGRRLFYDKHLSLDGQKACASCHHLQYGLSDSGYALSINEFGHSVRNAPALQNLAWSPLFFWDGRQPTLAAQAQDAFDHEMGLNVMNAIAYLQTDTTYKKLFKKAFGRPGTITENEIFLAVQEFVITAISCNSRFDSIQRGQASFTPEENDGFNNLFIMEKGDCFHCHTGGGASQVMTDFKFHNNCLDSAANIYDFKDPGRGGITGLSPDYGTFKSPSLRNIAVSGPYMHDGRYKTLQQVINFYSDSLQLGPNMDAFMYKHFAVDSAGNTLQKGGMNLSAQQKADILALLNSLTDTSFLHNPNLKSPF